jgi:glyoxylase-like metal-dependent hydrolase (beta-lactamase superfamily II)
MTKIVRITSFLGLINSFLLIDKKIIIVDSGFKYHHKKILNYLRNNHILPDQVSLIILTHAHLDHYDNINKVKKLFNVPVLATETAGNYFKNGANEPTKPTGFSGKLLKYFYYTRKVGPIFPDILITQEFDLNPYGVQGKIIPSPGHTKGSLSIIVNDTECLTGDLLRGGKIAWFIENKYEHLASINKLKSLGIKIIHPSHGKKFVFDDTQIAKATKY